MDLATNYFEFSYIIKNNAVNKVSVKLKKNLITNTPISKSNGSSVNWYIDKFGIDLGNKLYDIRKKYNSINSIVNQLLDMNIPDDDKTLLKSYIENYNNVRYHKMIGTYSDETFKQHFLKKMNKPNRIEKIKKSSIKMWENARLNDSHKYKKMLLSKSNKNYEINGFFMNSIEFLVANFLNELKVNWEYEKRIDIGNNTYFPDFYLIDYNSVIECYGDFWHANPMMMESTDKTHKYITAADVWRRDEIKNNNLLNVVNNVLILWESDIKNNKEQCITNIKSIANDKKLC